MAPASRPRHAPARKTGNDAEGDEGCHECKVDGRVEDRARGQGARIVLLRPGHVDGSEGQGDPYFGMAGRAAHPHRRYHVRMYLDALSFLDEEREAWRPYEALDQLTDEQLSAPVAGAHGWSGRDLIAHMVGWQELALAAAREFAVGETSATRVWVDAEWEARGDDLNDEINRTWAIRPMDEVRRSFRTVPGELRGYLTVVPEIRWVKNADTLQFFLDETIDHYEEHLPDLEAILESAR